MTQKPYRAILDRLNIHTSICPYCTPWANPTFSVVSGFVPSPDHITRVAGMPRRAPFTHDEHQTGKWFSHLFKGNIPIGADRIYDAALPLQQSPHTAQPLAIIAITLCEKKHRQSQINVPQFLWLCLHARPMLHCKFPPHTDISAVSQNHIYIRSFNLRGQAKAAHLQ